MEDCLHAASIEDIITCITDILAMTDCQKCLCDVLPVLCG
jgi:hypothetical protein